MGIIKVLASGVFLAFTLASPVLSAAGTIALKGGESAADRQKLAKVSVAAAKATALQHVHGEITEVELENEHGFLVYSVDVKTANGKVEVQIDAGNGALLAVEADDDDDKD